MKTNKELTQFAFAIIVVLQLISTVAVLLEKDYAMKIWIVTTTLTIYVGGSYYLGNRLKKLEEKQEKR